MKALGIFGILVLLFSNVFIALPDNVEAARMGGGRSFGSRPSMSQPAPSRSVQSPMQNRSVQPGAATPGKSGMFGGMGGILGGVLAGTLLGSLLSGNGLAGAGGGFMDLILLAILIFIGWKLFQRFRNRAPAPAGAGGGFGAPAQDAQPMARNDMGSSGWDALRRPNFQTPQAADPSVDIPADFDTEDFLKGARTVYNRMQSSWDKRDLADIAQFATRAVMQELEAQAAQDPTPSHTEIMTVNSKLLGVEDEGDNRRAQVYFDVLMREDPSAPTPENVREVWHFLRIGQNGSWKLDGIQQVN